MKIILCLICFFININIAFAGYNVDNIKIYAENNSVVIARDNALKVGQMKGFLKLMEQKNRYLTTKQEKSLSIDKILSLLENYELSNEKMTNHSYKAILSVTFNQKLTDKFILENFGELPPIMQAENLIIPAVLENKKYQLWNNLWFLSWKKLSAIAYDKNYVCPLGEPNDLYLLREEDFDISQSSYEDLQPIINKYGASNAIIAMVEYNHDENGQYNLDLYIKKINQFSTIDSFHHYLNLQGPDIQDLFYSAIDKILSSGLNNEQLYYDSAEYKDLEKISCYVFFKNLNEWNKIDKILSSMKSINKYNITSMSTSSYIIDIFYNIEYNRLIIDLEDSGLVLFKTKQGFSLKSK